MSETNIETPEWYTDRIRRALGNCLVDTQLFPGRIAGKVRDRYERDDHVVLVTTDRQSAFDRVLAAIPFKGQALNLTSAWWFEQTAHLIPNHVLAVPDPNVTIGRRCQVFPIEFVVRGYITGTTSTSLWTVYASGARTYCGNELPEGLVKNQRLPANLITPTTKETEHDRPIGPAEIVAEGWMSGPDWERCRDAALALFAFGQQKAAEHGLILVDTKYEMGRDADGAVRLIDEIHTPDSSRYWLADTYEERIAAGREPDNVDKEFLRLWFTKHCDPYGDAELPRAPDDLVVELGRRYVFLYERITGRAFEFPDPSVPIADRIQKNLATWESRR
jgi:phosphoribosylaminoimidazole-succinocarboxamide synthase